MIFRYLGIGFVVISATALFADGMKTYKHKKGKFSVKYPEDWTLEVDKDGTPVMVNAPDNAANVQVVTDTIDGKISACEFLAKTESSTEGGRTNLIPEDKRAASPAQLKFMGVKDGCIGAYKVARGEMEMLQGMGVYISGKRVWVLIQSLQAAARERHGKAVGDIAKSFTTK